MYIGCWCANPVCVNDIVNIAHTHPHVPYTRVAHDNKSLSKQFIYCSRRSRRPLISQTES